MLNSSCELSCCAGRGGLGGIGIFGKTVGSPGGGFKGSEDEIVDCRRPLCWLEVAG